RVSGEPSSPQGDSRSRKMPHSTPSMAKSESIQRLLSPVAIETASLSRPWEGRPALPSFSAEFHIRRPLPHLPLFAPRSMREVIAALAATLAPIGRIDLLRLVRTAARGHPVRVIPRKARRTLCYGLQLLVDIGEGMEPFSRDQATFVSVVRSVV